MVYPGSSRLLQAMLNESIVEGRAKLLSIDAVRTKIGTRDGNEIDTIFLERRYTKLHPNGDTLVICCEGNCGFYEVGMLMTPVEAHYSVLGWNHPGFGGSTGLPYPSQEQNAIEAVVRYAIEHLGFKETEIILYGWSIGGFTSSWAATKFPNIKGLIIDASFDDILPLALARMPIILHHLVTTIIRENINLNVLRNVVQYPGPFMFIRRADDEMITTRDRDIKSNRGNDLVFQVLKHRFPKLIGDQESERILRDWINGSSLERKLMWDQYFVDPNHCESTLASYIQNEGASYPMAVTCAQKAEKIKLILYLAECHMKELNSSHCVALPASMFRMPWSPPNSASNAYSLNKL